MKITIPLTLFVLAVPALAESPKASPAPSAVVTPADHQEFFRELDALMGKYPQAAKRFALFDREVRGPKLTEQGAGILRASLCPEGQHCGFFCWTSPATHTCCDCHALLK